MTELDRRQFLVRSGSLLLVAACGGEGKGTAARRSGSEGTGRGPGTEGARAGNRSGAAAPEGCGRRTVEHRHGSTEIAGVPERPVSLTPRDQDTLLALGAVPAAVRDGYYERGWAERPWVREALGDADPEILPTGGELSFERIAALRPDLIAAAGSGITDRDYDILSRIAPTVAQSGRFADYGAPWQTIARTLGRALCREEEAGARIARVEERIAAARREHPGLEGATVSVALPGGPDGSYWVYGPQDSRVRFFEALGMELPAEVAEVADDRFAATVSAERMDLLEADLIVWLASDEQRAALERNPVYQRLESVRAGRDLFLEVDGVATAALTNTSVLNVPYLLDELVPRIAAAVAGGARTGDGSAAAAGAPERRRAKAGS